MQAKWRKRRDGSGAAGLAPPESCPMKFELHWQGPYGAGLFPHTAEGMQNLLRAGVYLRIKSFSGGRTAAYVGHSKQVLGRSISTSAACSVSLMACAMSPGRWFSRPRSMPVSVPSTISNLSPNWRSQRRGACASIAPSATMVSIAISWVSGISADAAPWCRRRCGWYRKYQSPAGGRVRYRGRR